MSRFGARLVGNRVPNPGLLGVIFSSFSAASFMAQQPFGLRRSSCSQLASRQITDRKV